jgi:hypothetical protein
VLEHRRERFFCYLRLDEGLDNQLLRDGRLPDSLGNRYLSDAIIRDPLAATEQAATTHRLCDGNLDDCIVLGGFVGRILGLDRCLLDRDVLDG